jgi:DnaJ-class molecular chaperone
MGVPNGQVSMAMKDPYSVLGVAKSATAEDIKRSYRKLAKELHPDVNPDNKAVEHRFKEVTAAYHLLSEPEQRAKFDRGEINAEGSPVYENAYNRGGARGGGASGGYEFNFNRGGGAGFDDIFSDLFRDAGGQRGHTRSQPLKGKDVVYTVRVSFEDAAKGTKRRIKLYDEKMLDVKVPSGTIDGQTLRLKGQGMRGMGGAVSGDALVTIQVDPHRFFTLDGRDVHVTVPISLNEAVLGTKLTVPTIDGKVSLTIPEGASAGTKLRLKNKGLPGNGNVKGDQYVTLQVMLPEKPDAALKKFASNWGKGDGDELRKKAGMV